VIEGEDLEAARVALTLGSHGHQHEAAPNRLPDADAPWRRMLPPTKSPLLLPRTGADDTPPGDHLAV
jgi:hypothetical protein